MNTINFTNDKKNFPLSTQALEFLKLISQQSYQLAMLGGSGNYILSGCVNTTSDNWSAGWVVINGELLPFVPGVGSLTDNVHIVETKEDVIAGYDTYNDVYVTRTVEFGSNVGGVDTFVWNTFTRVKSNLELAAESATKIELEALSNLMMPKGGIIMWSGTIVSIPTGYALCDGSNNVSYGGVVPDLRGRFIVGYDSTKVNIPQNVTDTTQNYGAVGNAGGKPTVTLGITEIPSHNHAYNLPLSTNDMDAGATRASGGHDNDINNANYTTGNSGGGQAHENRPPYYVLAFIIKVV